MWPNELAQLIVEMLNLTSDEAKGVAVMSTFGLYALVILLIVSVPCALMERRK